MSRRIFRVGAGIPAVLLVAIVGAVVVMQGWRARIPNFDMLTTIDAAQALADTGRLPDRGVLTSFLSFTPPGAAWLMAPGVVVFHDPRLFEYIGSIGLYTGTLLGIFLLARAYLGRGAALLAVVLYGFSALGLSAASTLWQRYPIHCFTVWTVYWIARWADDDEPAFLAAAILTWAVGVYVFLEMMPLILVLPVIWLIRKPSVTVAPLAAASILAVVVWYPYLRFEASRRFVDVRSQVLRDSIRRPDFSRSWCDPAIAPTVWRRDILTALKDAAPSTQPVWMSVRRWVSDRVAIGTSELLLANFRTNSSMPTASILLFLLTVIGSAALSIGSAAPPSAAAARQRTWSDRLKRFGVGAGLVGAAANEFVLARSLSPDGVLAPSSVFAIREFQAALLIAAIVLVTSRDRVAAAIHRAGTAWATPGRWVPTGVLMLSLAVPWVLLFVVSDGERRFWWLWPLQVIPLAAAVSYVPRRLGAASWVARSGSCVLAVIVAANPVLFSRLDSWRHHGWSGQDAIEVEAVDHVASLMSAAGQTRVSIGYEVNVWRFMAMFNIADSRYKVGANFDLLLKYRHRIANEDRCAEGVSPVDTYRMVQAAPATANPAENNRIVSPRDVSFEITQHVGSYQIFRKNADPDRKPWGRGLTQVQAVVFPEN